MHIVGREGLVMSVVCFPKQSLVCIVKDVCDSTQIISDVHNTSQSRLPSYLTDPAPLPPWNSSQTPVSKGLSHPGGKKPH